MNDKDTMLPAPPPFDETVWFDDIYRNAQQDQRMPPWSILSPHPVFLQWANQLSLTGQGQQAAVIGCGLGDDAEDLARRGFRVTAFDIAPTAIAWCQQRFPQSKVNYQVADLFNPPPDWWHAYDFVLEIYTIQALPRHLRAKTIDAVANLVASGGELFVFTLGDDTVGDDIAERRDGLRPPWLLTKDELLHFEQSGLTVQHFEALHGIGHESSNLGFRVIYKRDG